MTTTPIGNSALLRVWANDFDFSGAATPPVDKVDLGWQRNEQPPHSWMNFVHYQLGLKANHFLARGAPDWNATTEYNAGAVVNHTGDLWVSLTTNNNSQPDEDNTDWAIVFNSQNSEAKDPIAVTVGATGDFPTINAALQFLSRREFAFEAFSGLHTITLLSGFEMAEQVIVRGFDMSGIQINGEDAVHNIVRNSLSTNVAGRFSAFTAIQGGALPVINVRFDMDTSGTATDRDGIRLSDAGSSAFVLPGAGVTNAGFNGFSARRGALFSIDDAVFDDAGNDGISVNGSYGTCAGASARDAGRYGIFANNSASVSAFEADARLAGDQGVRAFTGSSINFRNGFARKTLGTDSSDDIAVNNGGMINANGAFGGTSQSVNTITANGIIFK